MYKRYSTKRRFRRRSFRRTGSRTVRRYPRRTTTRRNTRKYTRYSKPVTDRTFLPYNLTNPDRQFAKLRYSETLNVHIPALTAPYDYVYRLNSLFDPDQAIGGHQPYGFDQLALRYERYRVLGSKISVRTFSKPDNTALGAQTSIRTLVVPSKYASALDTIYTPTGGDNIREIPRAKRSLTTYYSHNPAVVSAYCDSGTPLGKTKSQVMNDPYFEAITNQDINTGYQSYWHIIVNPVDPSSALMDCVLEIDITYYALFTAARMDDAS